MIKRIEMSWGWRMPCAAASVLLIWAAVMQSNDPDPWVWVAIYGLHGGIGLCATFGRVAVWPTLLVALLTAVWAATLWPSVLELLWEHDPSELLTGMSPDKPYVEQAREALGLTIAAAASAYAAALPVLAGAASRSIDGFSC